MTLLYIKNVVFLALVQALRRNMRFFFIHYLRVCKFLTKNALKKQVSYGSQGFRT
jgi:hypothetical protein